MKDKFIRRVKNPVAIDGDTIKGDIRLGLNVDLYGQKIRLFGVDAYETTKRGNWDNGLSEEEVQEKIALGKLAKKELQEYFDKSSYVSFESKLSPKELDKTEEGKYGRWLGYIKIEISEDKWLDWGQHILDKGYGYVRYYK